MTITECDKRNIAIIEAWEEWKNGSNYLSNEDLIILCALLNIPFPRACQNYLLYTDNPNHAKITTTSRTKLTSIFNFLHNLAQATK